MFNVIKKAKGLLFIFFLVFGAFGLMSCGGGGGGGLDSISRVSVDSAGVESDSWSENPSISSDGRYVAFESIATNLVAGDTNTVRDIFVRDEQLGTTTRVSVDTVGTEADDGSFEPSISSDGSYVAFGSDATNLVAGDTNTSSDIFVHDTVANTTTRVSVDSIGIEGDSWSFAPSISSDGSYVAFESEAENLVVGDTNATWDIFRAPNK